MSSAVYAIAWRPMLVTRRVFLLYQNSLQDRAGFRHVIKECEYCRHKGACLCTVLQKRYHPISCGNFNSSPIQVMFGVVITE